MNFECKNCKENIIFPDKYKGGKGFNKSEFINVGIKCSHCNSSHTLAIKYSQNEKNNTLIYLIDFEHIVNLKIKSSFWFKDTSDSSTLSGNITHCYLLLGFDKQKELKEKIKSIKNETDRAILNSCENIIRRTRNNISQHNKNKDKLSLLTENDIYPLFNNAVNTMVELFGEYGIPIFDVEDRRMEERKIILK